MAISIRILALSLATSFAFAPPARADDSDLEQPEDDEDEDDDLVEESKKDEADRLYVAGTEIGSLAAPIELKDESALEKLCKDVQPLRTANTNLDPAELRTNKRTAMRNVYSVVVAPGGFKIGDYHHRGSRLPLRLEHPLNALDGALRLIVVQRAGGSFEVASKDAAALSKDIEEKKLGLEVVFRIDGAMSETLAPCFSYPKSAAFALNVEPLSYALVEAKVRRAETKTPALAKLKEWMEPGKARLAIIATAEGPLDGAALTQAIETKRAELEACFASTMQSAAATGVVAYEASVARDGSLADVRLEAESLSHDEAAGACAAKVLATVGAPKAAKPSRAHVAFNIIRGDDDVFLSQ
jgi:hypothetical protein